MAGDPARRGQHSRHVASSVSGLGRDDDRQRRDDGAGRVVDRCRDRDGDRLDLAVADRVAGPADLCHGAAQPGRVGDGVLGVALERAGEHRVDLVAGRVGEEHKSDARRVRGQPAARSAHDVYRLPAGDPFHVDDIRPVQYGDLDVFVGDLVEILEERQRGLAQPDAARRQRADLPQP